MDITTFTEANGKKLTQPEMNLLAKLSLLGVKASDSSEFVSRQNRVSGATSHPLHPLVAALVDFCYQWYDNYERGQMSYRGHKVPVQTFDRAKYLVLKLDSDAYNGLID
jgi:hypothetical protein